jgi:hypothetical protein
MDKISGVTLRSNIHGGDLQQKNLQIRRFCLMVRASFGLEMLLPSAKADHQVMIQRWVSRMTYLGFATTRERER